MKKENRGRYHGGSSSTSVDVTVVVVNYNGAACIGQCLSTLLRDDPGDLQVEFLVVDNGSTDGSAGLIASLCEQDQRLRLVDSDKNLGYSGAVNLVLPEVQGRYLAILNMDLIVQSNWLSPLVAFLEKNQQVAAVNPVLLLPDQDHVNAAGQHIHVTGLGFNNNLGMVADTLPADPFRVSGIHGGAFMVRTRVLRAIGGMENTGFLYHEDVNLSWLLQLCGYELYCVPASSVVHDYFLTMYPEKFYLLERNRLMMLCCYLQPLTWIWLSPLLLCTELMTWGFALLRGGGFVRVKARALRWLWGRRPYIQRRRKWVRENRKLSDYRLFRSLHYRYVWGQCVHLGRERGLSARRPPGGLNTGGTQN